MREASCHPKNRPPLTRAELGALGERHAARALRAAGLRLLEANYRTKAGELDLIAREGDTLVFVEVRTRPPDAPVTPMESVNARKQAQVTRVARWYVRERGLPEVPMRYDVVEVTATPAGRVLAVRHIPGAFEAMEKGR
jgi:putative endonuclease